MKTASSTRLQQARERFFVGRAAQIESFATALQSESWPVAFWHIYGLGGIGKTSLLRQWKSQAQQAGVTVISLDGRDFEPTPAAFCLALAEALNEALQIAICQPATPADLSKALEKAPARIVLQIDTYEMLGSLDRFLRENFIAILPENAVVMLAGRNALSFEWRSDAAWRELVREWSLDALSRDEERLYLEKRGIAAPFQPQILEWAHGHPLALSLAADVWMQYRSAHSSPGETPQHAALQNAAPDFRPGEFPQLVGPLLEHLAREVPTPAHRAALEASAIVLSMTQELLADMMGDLVKDLSQNGQSDVISTKNEGDLKNEREIIDVRALFEWLRALSMMQSDRFGVFPHDLARELLVADLHWRNPDWHLELHRRAREHYLRRIQRASGAEQQRAIFNCIYLHRLSPVIGPYLRWNDSPCSLDSAHPGDVEVLLDMVEKHEGKTSRELAARHFEAQPEGVVVVRDASGAAQGFVFQLALRKVSPELCEADPAVKAALNFLRLNAPLRAQANKDGGDQATLFRFWMDGEIYQGVGATQSLIFVQAVRHYMTTPHLAFTLFPCADPDFWNDGFLYADIQRMRGADFEVGNRKFGVFGHDWRARPVLSWLDLLSQREMQSVAPDSKAAPLLTPGTNFVVLDEAQFHDAVHLALRSRDEALRRNPLLQTALVHRRAAQNASQPIPSLDERARALRALLKEAISELETAPRQEKAHRALELVFGRRSLSQEAAALVMNVSHSSLRRYLRAGVTQVSAALYEQQNRRENSESPFDVSQHPK